jgi:hypothetical protein
MMMKAFRSIGRCLLLAGCLGVCSAATACKPKPPSPPWADQVRGLFERADTVVLAQVVGVQRDAVGPQAGTVSSGAIDQPSTGGPGPTHHRLAALQTYKGDLQNAPPVPVAKWTDTCGRPPLVDGDKVLVFAARGVLLAWVPDGPVDGARHAEALQQLQALGAALRP